MKTILYNLEDGKVSRGYANPKVVALLMGEGIALDDKETEVSRLSEVIGPERATRWMDTLMSGGLSEDAALLAIADKDKPEGTVSIELSPPGAFE